MLTLARLQTELQDLFRVTARQAGRQSHFIQRQRKLSGETFVATLVWGWLANPNATLEELSQTAALCGVEISAQGLAKRMTAAASDCLRQVLEASLALVAEGASGSPSFLNRFQGIYLVDSTILALAASWQTQWPGSGNQHTASAALKLQTVWDYQTGRLVLSLHAGRDSDFRLPVPPLPAGAVRITDNGYFAVEPLQALAAQGSYYLSRLPAKVRLFSVDGTKQRLSDFLNQQAQPAFDGWVTLTGKGLACRLVAQPVPDTVLAQRQARIRALAKKRQQPVSQEALALARWTIVVTNLPETQLSSAEALVLLRLRWQIELLFKLFKQHSQLGVSRSQKPERQLCELYAKLLGLVLQHALLLATCWDMPNRSLVKLAQTIRKFTFTVAATLWASPEQFVSLCALIQRILRAGCRLNKRKAQPSHFQRLLSLS